MQERFFLVVINGFEGTHNYIRWFRRTSWGWWCIRWRCLPDTGLWRSEAEHDTSRSRKVPTILNRNEWEGKKLFLSLNVRVGTNQRLPLYRQAALITKPCVSGVFLGFLAAGKDAQNIIGYDKADSTDVVSPKHYFYPYKLCFFRDKQIRRADQCWLEVRSASQTMA